MKHQKLQWLLAIALLSGCATQQYPVQHKKKFPTYPHENSVRIFQEDTGPKEYYVDVLEINQISPRGDLKEAYTRLEMSGQSHGVDAVIIENTEDIDWTESDFGLMDLIASVAFDMDIDVEYEHFEATKIQAKGIKYVKNIDYLNQLVKSKEIQLINHEEAETECKIEYSIHGVPVEIEGNMYMYRKLEEFSIERLVFEENANWNYLWRNDSTLVRRAASQKVISTFQAGLPVEILYKNFDKYESKTQLSAIYSYHGQLQKIFTRQRKNLIMIQEFEYDDLGRITRQLIELPQQKKNYQVKYEYFRNDELKTLVPVIDGEIITEVPRKIDQDL